VPEWISEAIRPPVLRAVGLPGSHLFPDSFVSSFERFRFSPPLVLLSADRFSVIVGVLTVAIGSFAFGQ